MHKEKEDKEFKITLTFEIKPHVEIHKDRSVRMTREGFAILKDQVYQTPIVLLNQLKEAESKQKKAYKAFVIKNNEVIFELLKNSIDAYLDKSEIDLSKPSEVIFAFMQADGKTIVKITDNGCGISDKIKLNAEYSHKLKFPLGARLGGKNLGMKIVKEEIKKNSGHQGEFELNNRTDGQGAVVTISVPTEVLLEYNPLSVKSVEDISILTPLNNELVTDVSDLSLNLNSETVPVFEITIDSDTTPEIARKKIEITTQGSSSLFSPRNHRTSILTPEASPTSIPGANVKNGIDNS